MIEFLLFIIAIILFVLLAPLGLITQIVMVFIKDNRERYSKLGDFFFGLAFCIDILGNICCGDLFNIIMLKHNTKIYKFGRRGETISSAFGKNIVDNWEYKYKIMVNGSITIRFKYSKSLTNCGNILYNILDAIDPNHCIKSIQSF